MTLSIGSPMWTIRRTLEICRYDACCIAIATIEIASGCMLRYCGDTDGDVTVQEVTQRILEAVGGIAGSSLEQTSWLSRSLEVKVQPQVCPEADEPEDADVDGDNYGNLKYL